MKSYELPSFFIFISDKKGKEKLSIGPIAENTHLTFHLGTKSKFFDIHLTHDGKTVHETLFKIRHFTLFRVLIMFHKRVLPIIYKKFYTNYINLGKLRKYECYLQPVNVDNLDLLFRISSNQNRIKLKKQIDKSALNDWFIHAEDFVLKDDCYFVYRNRKGNLVQNGVLYKRMDIITSESFIYLSQQNFRKMVRTIRIGFLKMLKEVDNNTYSSIKLSLPD